jgi:predicted dehydrogenase
MIRFGLLGYGYWGPNLARNIQSCSSSTLARIVDLSSRRREAARRDCPGIDVTADPDDVLKSPDIDAVAIATPFKTHFELALRALENGKHVLVEKPMADTSERCERLIEEAERRNLILMVDHTFLYTAAVRWMREFVATGKLGQFYYFDSVRTNLGLYQRDANVLWDLAPHDLSILCSVTDRRVVHVSATGTCHAGSRVPDIAYISLDLGDGVIAHFHVNWLSPVKLRRIVLAGSERMILFDDLETSEKIRVYDSGVEIEHLDDEGLQQMKVDYRIGDMVSPALVHKEALQMETEHFTHCIATGEKPLTDGYAGLAVTRILEAAEYSLKRGGAQIAI